MKKIFKAFGAIFLIVFAVIFLDIGCFFRYTIGVPCLGCGTTRACVQFLQGHLVDAFYWHPLFWFTVPLLALLIVKQQQVFRSKAKNRVFWITIFAMYLSVYIVRMVMLFPDTPPMDYNQKAILWQIYDFIRSHTTA